MTTHLQKILVTSIFKLHLKYFSATRHLWREEVESLRYTTVNLHIRFAFQSKFRKFQKSATEDGNHSGFMKVILIFFLAEFFTFSIVAKLFS